jgi:hypothetical protein
MQYRWASRKCACRREWNSHEAAKPLGTVAPLKVISCCKIRIARHELTPKPETYRGRLIRIDRGGKSYRERIGASSRIVIASARKPRNGKTQKVGRPRLDNSPGTSRQSRGSRCKAQSAMQKPERVPADAGYRDCSCRSAARAAESFVCKITRRASSAHGCLTPRSSGAPTAGHQARAGGTPSIFTGPGLVACRRRPLSSNVRPRRTTAVLLAPSMRTHTLCRMSSGNQSAEDNRPGTATDACIREDA